MAQKKFPWEEEGGVLGSLEGAWVKNASSIMELAPAAPSEHPPGWAKTALSLYRLKEPAAELCLADDEWRIEVGIGRTGASTSSPFVGLEVWRAS